MRAMSTLAYDGCRAVEVAYYRGEDNRPQRRLADRSTQHTTMLKRARRDALARRREVEHRTAKASSGRRHQRRDDLSWTAVSPRGARTGTSRAGCSDRPTRRSAARCRTPRTPRPNAAPQSVARAASSPTGAYRADDGTRAETSRVTTQAASGRGGAARRQRAGIHARRAPSHRRGPDGTRTRPAIRPPQARWTPPAFCRGRLL